MMRFTFAPRAAVACLALTAAAALSGCMSAPLSQPISGYTCCNLRDRDGWISSDNVQGGDLIPFGSNAQIKSAKRKYYLYGAIGDSSYGFRNDWAKAEQDSLDWARRLVVTEDPRTRLSNWPSEVRAAVGAARVVRGMTKEQVTMALGYPSPGDTPNLADATWRYWTTMDDNPVDLVFGTDGKLADVVGSRTGIRLIEMQK